MQLRPHQIDSLVAMQSNTKGQVIVPTGGGKICPSSTNLGAGTWQITLPKIAGLFIPTLRGVRECFGVAVKKYALAEYVEKYSTASTKFF